MAIDFPANFNKDIQGRDTALVPVVVFGTWTHDEVTTPNVFDWYSTSHFISTNSFSFSDSHGDETVTINVKPILLNIPSLRESIDLEKRNYKISNVNLDISNLPFEGVRFSEHFGNSSLINIECRIYWWSPNSTLIFPQDKALSDYSAMQIYHGIIRRYTHSDEKVKLTIEDRSQAYLHRPLPNTNVGTENVPDHYKNKYVPMVYGKVEHSPVVGRYAIYEDIEETPEADEPNLLEFKLKADTEDIQVWAEEDVEIGTATTKKSALFFFENDTYHNVHRTNEELGSASPGLENFRYGNTDIILDTNDTDSEVEEETGVVISNDFSQGLLRVHTIRQFDGTKTEAIKENAYANIDMTTGGGNVGAAIGSIYLGGTGQSMTRAYFKCYLDPMATPSDIEVDAANVVVPPKTFLLFDVAHWNYDSEGESFYPSQGIFCFEGITGQYGGGVPSDTVATPWAIWSGALGGHIGIIDASNSGQHNWLYDPANMRAHINDRNNISVLPFDNTGLLDFAYASHKIHDLSWFKTLTSFDHVNIGIPYYYIYVEDNPNDANPIFRFNFILREAFIAQEYRVYGITNKDYYASVHGRLGATSGAYGATSPSAAEVIADIMQTELGVVDINSDELSGEYDNWQYAFTVDKKTNSKRLIENIASASPYIPRFDNMGNFKFDVIKEKYEKSSGAGFTEFIEIKSDEVISSSFTRTPIEQVYTKIEFKYRWDYARESFQKRMSFQVNDPIDGAVDTFKHGLFNDIQYEYGYYVLLNDNTESTLIIDDDRGKYIRKWNTAVHYVQWMLLWHCNQHLIIKVRLPLKYMNIEIGNILRFDEIIDVKPYGIDYSKNANYWIGNVLSYGDRVNGQHVFPDFMVTSTNKTLEYCDIECMQMHNLQMDAVIDDDPVGETTDYTVIGGCMNPAAWNYNPEANEDDGSCLLPPYTPDGYQTVGDNTKWLDLFLEKDKCPILLLSTENVDYYAANYPYDAEYYEIGDTMISPNNGTFELGDILLAPNGTFAGTYFAEHMAAAKAMFIQGYDVETGAIAAMYHPRFYSMAECTWAQVESNKPMRLNLDMEQLQNYSEGSLSFYFKTTPVNSSYIEEPSYPDIIDASGNPQERPYHYHKWHTDMYFAIQSIGGLRLNFQDFIFKGLRGELQPIVMRVDLLPEGYVYRQPLQFPSEWQIINLDIPADTLNPFTPHDVEFGVPLGETNEYEHWKLAQHSADDVGKHYIDINKEALKWQIFVGDQDDFVECVWTFNFRIHCYFHTFGEPYQEWSFDYRIRFGSFPFPLGLETFHHEWDE